jgi:DNA-binding NarL/FixJ family response regulator
MKALIVEDEELVRELLASVVSREFEFNYVKEASDGESAWGLFQIEKFDFVVLDLMLPKLDGLSLARRILQVAPDVRILALSSECDDYTIREVTRSGILGFVHKQEMSLETLFTAFNDVSAGEIYYSANAQKIIAGMWKDPDAYYKVLSDRELQVLRLIAQGHDHVSAGEILGIRSDSTSATKRASCDLPSKKASSNLKVVSIGPPSRTRSSHSSSGRIYARIQILTLGPYRTSSIHNILSTLNIRAPGLVPSLKGDKTGRVAGRTTVGETQRDSAEMANLIH